MPFEDDIAAAYRSAESVYGRVLEDIRWHLDRFFEGARTSGDSDREAVARIYFSSRVTQRVKALDSLYRKCKRERIESVEEAHSKIEDLIGLRIATPNKEQAEALFDFFRTNESSWFCVVSATPKFVPYTIPDRSRYSLETGYQAYHVTFVHDKHYRPVTTLSTWPVEIQIMSQLWEFWSSYSRKYFYGGSDAAARLLPYNVVISRILDAAEDLMVATTHDIESGVVRIGAELAAESEEAPAPPATPREIIPSAPTPPIPGEELDREGESNEAQELLPQDVGAWLKPRLVDLFGPAARMPGSLFLTKIAEDLNLYGVRLGRLEAFFKDGNNETTYRRLLRANGVSYLPPYQQILCRALIGLGWDITQIVERVNRETWSLGIRLTAPSADSA